MKNIHIVPHTHWDHEWYFTVSDTITLSDSVFSDMLNHLEENKKAKFCLDGQTSIIESYLKIRPDYRQKIIDLVSQNRLEIGPWYTQTDCQNVDGESIIRNLAYGIWQANKLGKPMNNAYLPDSFGFNPQMPTIVKSCGIDYFMFRRGADFDVNIKDCYFKWKGLSKKEVKAVHILDGYGMANELNISEEFRNQRLLPYINRLEGFTKSKNLMLCSGGDQEPVNINLNKKIDYINEHIDKYKCMESTYSEFLDSVDDYFKEIYEGEIREGRYDRSHRTIGGIRYDIKKTSHDVEQLLLKTVEPLMAIGHSLGIEVSTELLYEAWKNIMYSQAHDGMGGCVTDNVAKHVLDRNAIAKEYGDAIENLIKFKISEKLNLDKNKIIIFNTDIEEFRGYKDISFLASDLESTIEGQEFIKINHKYFEGKDNILIENPEGQIYVNEDPYYQIFGKINCQIPPLGFRVYRIVKGNESIEEYNNDYIENEYYKIKCDDMLEITNKSNSDVISNFISLEDVGNDGDTYDFSTLEGDTQYLDNFKCIKIESFGNINKMHLVCEMKLPIDLENRIKKEKFDILNSKLIITLDNTDIIGCQLEVDNNILSHRLRAVIKTNIKTKLSISSVPFGYLERKNLNGKAPAWNGYNEIPIDIYPLDELCALSDSTTAYVVTKGIKEFQAIDSSIYLTLLSTTSELGKPNLAYRPGRASGDTTKKGHIMINTPLAEQQGKSSFEFGIKLTDNKFDEQVANNLIREYKSPSISYQKQDLNMFINRLDNKIFPKEDVKKIDLSEYSLLNLDTELKLSSLSPSLKDKGYYLLRLKNQTKNQVDLKNTFHQLKEQLFSFEITNCIEEVKEEILELDGYDFINIKIKI